MTKEKSIVPAMPSGAISDGGKYVTRQAVQQLPFWAKLKERERTDLTDEIKGFVTAKIHEATSGLAMGMHLQRMRAILAPHRGAYKRLLRSTCRFSYRTGDRYIKGYENALKHLKSENIVKAAAAIGLPMFSSTSDKQPLGKYTRAVQMLPPPRNPDPEQSMRYVQQVDQTYKEEKKHIAERKKAGKPVHVEAPKYDKKDLQMNAYRATRNALTHIPSRGKVAFLETHVGMLLTELGISGKTSFSPEAIPDDFRQGRGRPRLTPEPVTIEGNTARVM